MWFSTFLCLSILCRWNPRACLFWAWNFQDFLFFWQCFNGIIAQNIQWKHYASPIIKVKFCLHALFSWNADVNFCLTLVLQGMKQFNRLGNLSLKFSAVLKRVGCINCWLTAIIPAEPFCREKKKIFCLMDWILQNLHFAEPELTELRQVFKLENNCPLNYC